MKLIIKTAKPLAAFLVLCFSALITSCQAAPLQIVTQGKSTFTIVAPKIAPQSVNDAAAEMQRDIKEATGAKLLIRKDTESIKQPYISLGATKQAQAAGIPFKDIPDDGFRIVTKAGNLYVVGLDTTAIDLNRKMGRPLRSDFNVELHPEIPGPAFTKNGGSSNGTANGVYTFLEDYLDVRWLMPGDIGRDVPSKSTFEIDNVDRTESPDFSYRIISLLGTGSEAYTWRNQLKLGYSFRLNHNHNWGNMVPASLYKTHPEWFAMGAKGERLDPQKNQGKIETTNPELVKYVAGEIIKAFKENPELNTFSLSPSDGAGFSQSPESKVLWEEQQGPIIRGPSMTPLMLKFYTDVSNLVAQKYPKGKLAGYLYAWYMYPPAKGSTKIPDNFVPVLTSIASGYGFYDPVRRQENTKLINEWGKIIHHDWFYYAFLTWMRGIGSKYGVITTAAPKFMNSLFGDLAKNGCKGAYLYGDSADRQTVMTDYILAKMLWNPHADAAAIQRDWLARAYGPKAGAIMEDFYNKMDESWFSDYFRGPNSTWHNISETFYKETYGAHYPEMEKLILKAKAQPMTDIQRQRFVQVIGNNMRLLQYRLRQAGYLPADYSSPLTITTQQALKLIPETVMTRTRYVGLGKEVKPVKIRLGEAKQGDTADIPNPWYVMVYPTKDGEVRITPTEVHPGSSFLFYYVIDQNNREIKRGLLTNNEEFTFTAKANTPYYIQVINSGVTLHPQFSWGMSIPGALPATAAFHEGTLYLQPAKPGKTAPVYVYLPPGLPLQQESTSAGVLVHTETAETTRLKDSRAMLATAKKALEDAQKQYQASVVKDLDGGWRFIIDPKKRGEAAGYSNPQFDDGSKSWKTISAIGYWRDHGFSSYHGTAWYRRNFTLSSSDLDPTWLNGRKLILFFGAIDGDADIYVNGVKIESRVMANYSNGWEQPLAFDINDAVHEGKNTIAVKVTKDQFAAGLYRGVGLLAGMPLDAKGI